MRLFWLSIRNSDGFYEHDNEPSGSTKFWEILEQLRDWRFLKDSTEWSYVGSEVLRVVGMKSVVFWDMTPCSSLKVNRCFGGTYRLHLQSRRIR
jgi:hypothetical protein